MSDLTETSSPLNVTNLNDIGNTTGSSEPNDNINSIITTKKGSIITTKKGGRPKGVTKAAAEKKDTIVKESLTKAAILYEEACKEARKSGKNAVPKGTLERIVSDVETVAGLSENSISIETVRSRIKRGNPDGTRTYSVSPIADLEPLIVEFVLGWPK
jgi:hypothetical protein